MTVGAAALIAAGALLGIPWRWWFGGWGGAWLTAATGGLTSGKTAARWAALVFTAPAWAWWPWWQAALLGLAAVVYFSETQDFAKPWKVALRYGLPLAALCGTTGLWWGLPAAPVPALASALLRGRTVPTGGPVTGWQSWWEASLGASACGLLVAVGTLTHGWAW